MKKKLARKKPQSIKSKKKPSPYQSIISPKCRKQIFGRPTKFRSGLYRDAEKLSALGFTDREICKFWGVSAQTLQRWEKGNPTFVDVLERGRLRTVKSITRRMIQAAEKGNITAGIFILTNFAPELWKDRRAPTMIQANNVSQTGARVDDRFNGDELQTSNRMREYLLEGIAKSGHNGNGGGNGKRAGSDHGEASQ